MCSTCGAGGCCGAKKPQQIQRPDENQPPKNEEMQAKAKQPPSIFMQS